LYIFRLKWKEYEIFRRTFYLKGGDSMFAAVYGMTVLGLHAHLIRVEVDVANGLPSFESVGFPLNIFGIIGIIFKP